SELAHRGGHDLPITPYTIGLKRRLDLVVTAKPLVGLVFAEDARKLTADPEVPVDQGSIAVERRPAVSRHCREPSFRTASGRSRRCGRRSRTSSTRSRAHPRPATRSGCSRGHTQDPRLPG